MPGTIALDVKVDEIYLNIDTAIPCSLILNEAVSNCFKHAFPQGRKGEIKIALHSVQNNRLKLTVKDNGIGIPEELDFRKTESLGLQLARILTEQIDGTVDLRRDNGTIFKLIFEEQKEYARTDIEK